MGTTWVLRTDTKGTGAQMVPLEKAPERSSQEEPGYVLPKLREVPEPDPEPRAPHRFRILDVMTRQPLADDVGTRDAVNALKSVRSIVDITVYVWQPETNRWRMLTLPEQRALWELAATPRARA
jgi:hypothetical protein